MTDISKLMVTKRDGEDEPFSYDKLISSFLKAGIPTPEAASFSKVVQTWALSNSKNGKISSTELRDKIIEVMSKDFSSEADSYQAYIKG